MPLTPVHVRGKRKTPSHQPPLALQNQPQKMKKSLSTVRASRVLKDKPTLESMPLEILEPILIYSANISLPRASHFIGAKLSSRTTQLRFFISVFHPVWAACFGTPASLFLHKPWKTGLHKEPFGDYDLQSEMIALPWVNFDFLLQAQQTWISNNARDGRFRHATPWEDSPDIVDHESSHFDVNSRECFEVDYQQSLKWPAFKEEATEDWGNIDIHPLTRIPTDLITGPWDDEKQRRLFWFFRGGIDMDSKVRRQPPWEVKLECIRNAVLDVSEPNVLVVNLLFKDWLFTGLPRDAVRKELANIQKRLEWGGDTPESKEIVIRTQRLLDLNMYLPDYSNA